MPGDTWGRIWATWLLSLVLIFAGSGLWLLNTTGLSQNPPSPQVVSLAQSTAPALKTNIVRLGCGLVAMLALLGLYALFSGAEPKATAFRVVVSALGVILLEHLLTTVAPPG